MPAGMKTSTRYGNTGSFVNMAEVDRRAAIENATRDIAGIIADPAHPLHELIDRELAPHDPVEALRQAKARQAIAEAEKAKREELERQKRQEAEEELARTMAKFNNYLRALRELPEHDQRKLIPGDWKDAASAEFADAVSAKLEAEERKPEAKPKPAEATGSSDEANASDDEANGGRTLPQALVYARARYLKGQEFTGPMKAALEALPEEERTALLAEWDAAKSEQGGDE